MDRKRKPEGLSQSERSRKIRVVSTASDQEVDQDSPAPHSPSNREDAFGETPTPDPASIPAPLTKKNLRRLESMTKSKGTKSTTSAILSSKTGSTATSDAKSISTTHEDFEGRFRVNGAISVLKSRKIPPSNKDEVTAYALKMRESASPTSSQQDYYLEELEQTSNEREVEELMCGSILKTHRVPELRDINYRAKIDKQWVAYPKDVGFNNGLSAPKPDRAEGYAQTTFPPNIKQLGGSATLVNNEESFIALPHFAAELKDFGKSLRQCEVQAGYDGAAMIYARNKALASIGQADPPGRASPITVASDGRTWRTYVHYSKENEESNKTEYYQYQVASGDLTQTEDLRRGYRVLRNAQDWGRKEATDLRDRMKQHHEAASRQPAASSSKVPPSASVSSSNQQISSLLPYKSPVPPRAPSSRSDHSAYPPGPVSSAITKAIPRPSTPPSDTNNRSSSKCGGKQRAAPPPAGRAMLPPPPTASPASRAPALLPSERGEPQVQRLLPPAKAAAVAPAPLSTSSASSSGVSRAPTPRSTSSSTASLVPGERRLVDDRDHSRDQAARGRDRDDERYRRYRDRHSETRLEPVQRRRSDSPEDKGRPSAPRPQDAAKRRARGGVRERDRERDRDRDARSGDRARDRDRDRRYERGAGSGSSTGSSSVNKVLVPPPPKPKGGIFSRR